jgi:DNA-binding NarL/FixJ family response regulator
MNNFNLAAAPALPAQAKRNSLFVLQSVRCGAAVNVGQESNHMEEIKIYCQDCGIRIVSGRRCQMHAKKHLIESRGKGDLLTEKEIEIIVEIANGKSVAEISQARQWTTLDIRAHIESAITRLRHNPVLSGLAHACAMIGLRKTPMVTSFINPTEEVTKCK